MERPALELREVFEEDSDEGSDIPCGLLCCALLTPYPLRSSSRHSRLVNTYHILPVLSVREPSVDRLVDEEDIRAFVPRVRVPREVAVFVQLTWTYRNMWRVLHFSLTQ